MSNSREWTPRVWQGCTFPAFLRLLWTNGFAVAPRYFYMPLAMTTVSAINSALQVVQESWYGSKLDRTPICQPPLFIIGHWRTGTTLLHELLALDPHFTYPNTYQCFAPHHFLLTEPLADFCLRWMLPSRRPMDNMAVGWSRPQEDEFALCMLGQPSPYLTIAFPNRPAMPTSYLDLDGLPPRQLDKWKRAFVAFLKRVTFHDPRRLLLKSPTHSCRIPTLLQLFPRAQFLHVVRNPFDVFSSTVKLWQTLFETHGLQVPHFRGLEEYVFTTFSHLYNRIQEGRALVPAGNYHELRYEDLIADPVESMRFAYAGLRLGEFEEARPRIEAFWSDQSSYQTNRFAPLDPSVEAEIARRWADVIKRYGYSPRRG